MNTERNAVDQLLAILNSPLCAAVGGRLDEFFNIPETQRQERQTMLDKIVAEEKNKLNQTQQK